MATFNLTAEATSANLLDTLGEDDEVGVGRIEGEVPMYQAIGFEPGDRLNLRAFPELTAELMLAAGNPLEGGGVRFETPFFTLTLGGINIEQLTSENFIFTSPPIAVADATTIAEGGTAVIPVLANDSDGDGDSLSITAVSTPANGTVVISGDTAIYNPTDPTFSGLDSFVYSITDGTGTDSATVTVTVGGNLPPDAVADTVQAVADRPTTIDVLANDTDPDGDSLSIASVTNGANGTVSIVDSQVVYTPNELTFTGTDSFNYTVTDGNGGTDWAKVYVTVIDNQPPIANPDNTTIAVGATASISVLENDSDPNGQALMINAVSNPLNGSAVIDGDQIIYRPGTTPGGTPFGGVDTFFYTIGDGNGGTASSMVTVTVGGPQPPVANDDTIGTPLGVAVSIDVLANDTDGDGDTLSISGIPSATANGTLSLNGDQVVYTPNAGFDGTESFTYTVSDGALTDTATVSLQVGGQLPPIASPDSATSQNGTAVSIAVLTNDSDPNGDSISITGVGTPANGTATFVGDEVVFTPPADTNFVGTVTFPYSITDGNEGTATADITVTVNRERPPIANPDGSTIEAGSTATVNVLVNDSDPDGDSITITGVSTPDNGVTTFVGDQVIYIPNKADQTPDGQEDFSGTDSFFYSITDGNGGTASTSVRVTVGGNQPPDGMNDATGTAAGSAVTIDVLANDTDPEGNTISLFQTGSGANGSTSISNNAIVYTPNSPTFIGEDSFVYTISDGNGGVDTATVTVQVGELPPVATDDTATLAASSTQTQLINVLANDSDPDGGTFTLTDVGNGSRGFAIISNNQIAYTPNGDFAAEGGTDSFTYTITNNQGRTDTATVTVLANQPPVANDDEVTIQTLGIATIPVLDNDTDADGDTLQLVQSAIAPGNGGQVVFNNGNIIYTAGQVSNPNQPFVGETTFTYSITDGNGGGDEATVTVNVGGMQPPVAVNDTVTVTAEGGAQSIDVLANDSDPDTDNGLLLLQQVGQGANGAVAINNNQAVYTPSSTTFAGTDSFIYTITDPQGGGQDSATATVIVQGNLPPLPQPDSATLPVGGSTTIDVLANDSDPNPGDSLTVTGVTGNTTNGTAQLVGNQVIFTTTVSDTTFQGTDALTYTVSDSSGATATSTVTVSIGGNQPPMAVNDSATVTNVSSVVINVLTNDSDPNNDSLTVVGAGGATNGTGLQLNSTQVLYTPATSTTATTDSFTYTVSDGRGGSDTATITVNINENGAPTAVADTTTISAGGTATIDVLANDSDPDGDSLQLVAGSVNLGELDNGGSLTIVNNQVIYTTPNTSFVGSELFTYSVTDGFAAAPGTVTVIVGGNQPPVANNDAVTTIAGGTTSIPVLLNDSDPDANTNLSITGVGTPTNGGSVTISNNGTPTNPIDDQIVYISPSSTALTDSFTYSITDQQGGVDSATVSVTINGNQAPTANNDAFTIAVPSTSTLDVLENDSDPNAGDTLRIIGAANASSLGSVTFTSDRVIYTPNSGLGTNFTGTDSFTYTIADAGGVTATATGVVTLGGIQPPDAVRDTAGTSTGIATTIDVLANDTDPSGTLTLTSFATTTSNGGTITRDTSGSTPQTDDKLIYTPNATFTGTDSFIYTVTGSNTLSDGTLLTDSAAVTVTVSANQPPVANPDTVTIQLGSASTLPVLNNDFDPNGEALSVIGAGGNNTSLGTVSVSNGQVLYTPNSGLSTPFVATDSFTYTIRDSAATGTSTATVTVTLGGNQPPTAGADTATAIQAIPTTIAVLANDSDPDASPNGGTLSITGVSTPANGTVTINNNGTPSISSDDVVIYTSTNSTFTGTDTFVYSVTDSNGTSGSTVSATVNVTVNQNGAPTAVNDNATVLATGASTINVLSNDTDPNTGVGDILSVTGVGNQGNTAAGSVALTNGQVIYTSAGNASTFTGTDSFTYSIRDLNGNTSTASVSVTVGGPQSPIANADSITVTQGSTATLSAGLTGNDSDPNGDTFTIVGVSSTTSGNGTANVTGGQVIYNAPTVAGTDTFTYSIGDATGTSSATVTVTLNPSNAPIAVNDTVTTQTETAVTIAVLANDSDPDGDALQLDSIDTAALVNGSAVTLNNQVIYTPNAGFSGLERFTYAVTDGLGGTSSATVAVTVGGPQPPNAVDDTTFTPVQAIPNTLRVLGNDSDPDNGTLSITGVSTATNGTVAINNNGTPNSGDDVVVYTTTSTTFTGTDSFTYTITDGQGGTDSATVSFTVEANQAPTAVNDTDTILATGSSTIDVTSNDTDPNGASDSLSVSGVGGSNDAVGTVALSGGQVIYTPNSTLDPNTANNDTFIYTISDLSGNTSTASVSLTVGGPLPPVANDDSVTITQGTTQTLSALLTDNDSDPNAGDTFTIVGVSASTTNGGTANVTGGQVVYTAPTTAGTDSFTYSIADATGTDAATVTVSVIAGSTTPVANNDYAIAIEGATATTIPVLLSDSDPNGDTLSITGVTITGSGTAGTVAVNNNGTPTISSDDVIIYTSPAAGTAPATDTITYTITDGGSTGTGTVTVGVFADAAGTDRSITGDANSNVLVGSDGTNNSESLIGGSGNDILIARGGIDILTGGAGNDIFRYESENDSTISAPDRIEDFATGDSIQIVADGFAATTPSASDLAFISTGSGFLLQIGNTNFALVVTTTLAQSDVSSAIAFI